MLGFSNRSLADLYPSYQRDPRNKLSGKTALYYAVEQNLPEIFEDIIFLEGNDIVNYIERATYIHRIAPIHVAAREGYLDCLKKLIELNANINVTTAKQQTPLHLAVQNNQLLIVHVLLEAGASLNLINEDHETPLDIALNVKDHKMIQALQSRGAKTAEHAQDELPLNGLKKKDIFLATVANNNQSNVMMNPFAYTNFDDVFVATEVVLATVVKKSKTRAKPILNQHNPKRSKSDVPKERYITQRGREFGEFCFGQLMQELVKFSEFTRKTIEKCNFSRTKVVRMIEDKKEWPEFKAAALSCYDKMIDELLPVEKSRLQSKC